MSKKTRYLFLGILTLLFILFLINVSISQEGSGVTDKLLGSFKKEYKPVEPLLPPDIKIMPDFKPGEGPIIGNVETVEGKVYVVHQNQSVAYTLQKGHPLFSIDTIVTDEGARVNARLNDKSVFALSAYTKLTVGQAVYDPDKNERSSLINLVFGRARFIVAKISGKTDYRVKTPTAVCGIRGSDFALIVAPEAIKLSSKQTFLSKFSLVGKAYAQMQELMTIIVTGSETNVNFFGFVGPSMTVGPYSVSAAVAGGAAMSPVVVGAAAALGALNSVGPGLASLGMPPE